MLQMHIIIYLYNYYVYAIKLKIEDEGNLFKNFKNK